MISKGKFKHLRKIVAVAARCERVEVEMRQAIKRIATAFQKGGFYIDRAALEKARTELLRDYP